MGCTVAAVCTHAKKTLKPATSPADPNPSVYRQLQKRCPRTGQRDQLFTCTLPAFQNSIETKKSEPSNSVEFYKI
jgi:hypothetical protein